MMVTFRISVGFLLIISGVFLAYAVYLIKTFLSKEGHKTELNAIMLVIHACAFGLYMLSVMIFDLFFALNYYGGYDEK